MLVVEVGRIGHTHNRVAGCNGKSSQTGKLEVAGERRKEKGKGEISKSFSLFMERREERRVGQLYKQQCSSRRKDKLRKGG